MGNAALLALLITAAAVSYIAWKLRIRNGISFRKALIVLSAAVFVSLVIIYCPVTLNRYAEVYTGSGGAVIIIAAVLQSVQNAARTFVLDGAWSDLLQPEVNGVEIPMYATVIGLFLNVLAPVLTFSAILSMFKEFTARARVRLMSLSRRPLFLFSELNRNTVFLAQDIRRKYPKANLVYTDVYPEDDESNYELREQAAILNAVSLRTDITELKIKERKSLTEYFLFGHDEEENVTQAKKLFMKNKERKDTAIYVLSVRKGNALMIDSMTASLDVNEKLQKAEERNWDYEDLKAHIRGGGILRLRRIDPERQTAWREIPKIECIRKAMSSPAGNGKKTLSILVLADTHLSYTIIRTLLWFCQSDKFRLEINVVYADYLSNQESILSGRQEGKVNVRSLLEFDCPDIIRTNGEETEGDAFYDIEFIESTRFEQGEFLTQLIKTASGSDERSETAKRLLKTDLVITDRGNDDETLETAAFLRTTFERLNKRPEIYAVCEDEEELLKDLNEYNNIITYKDANYDIRFIGRRHDTYSYENIRNSEEEDLGFCQHIKWIDVSNSRDPSESRDKDLKRELLNYERHEYYRDSSVSKAMYIRNVICDPDQELDAEEAMKLIRQKGLEGRIDENSKFEWRLRIRPEYECQKDPKEPRDRWLCACRNCTYRRELEHNRWNAYMRTQGYIPSPSGDINDKRAMAMVHGNLVPFGELKEEDRKKDG